MHENKLLLFIKFHNNLKKCASLLPLVTIGSYVLLHSTIIFNKNAPADCHTLQILNAPFVHPIRSRGERDLRGGIRTEERRFKDHLQGRRQLGGHTAKGVSNLQRSASNLTID